MSKSAARTQLIALSQLMLVYAEQARWEELQSLETEFNQQLKQYFDGFEDADLTDQLLEQNQQIQQVLKAEQTKISQQHSKDLSSAKAMRSYLKS